MGIFPETYNEPKSLPYRPFTSARGGEGGGLTYKTSKEDQCGCGSSLN